MFFSDKLQHNNILFSPYYADFHCLGEKKHKLPELRPKFKHRSVFIEKKNDEGFILFKYLKRHFVNVFAKDPPVQQHHEESFSSGKKLSC